MFDFLKGLSLSTRIAKEKVFHVELDKLPPASVVRVLAYGFQRYVNDKCGGSDVPKEKKFATAKATIDDLLNGIVGKRRPTSGADAETLAARRVMKVMVKGMLSPEDYKTFVGMEPVAQLAKLDGWIEANWDVIAEDVELEMRRAEEEAAKRTKLAAKIKIAL